MEHGGAGGGGGAREWEGCSQTRSAGGEMNKDSVERLWQTARLYAVWKREEGKAKVGYEPRLKYLWN